LIQLYRKIHIELEQRRERSTIWTTSS